MLINNEIAKEIQSGSKHSKGDSIHVFDKVDSFKDKNDDTIGISVIPIETTLPVSKAQAYIQEAE